MWQAIGNFITQHTFWFVVICIAAIGIFALLVLAALWIYGSRRPVTKQEKYMRLPGDELIGDSGDPFDRIQVAITIDAPREHVWKWIAQLGQRKAGFYSLSWLERLLGFHIYNEYRIVEEYAHKEPGEFMFYHQCGIGTEVVEVKENEYFTTVTDSRNPSKVPGAFGFKPPLFIKYFGWTWNFYLWDTEDGKTRFLSRCDACYEPYKWLQRALVALILGTVSFVMITRMLDVIKQCAEGRHREFSFVEKQLRKLK